MPACDRWGVDLVRQGDVESAGVKMIIGDIMDVELPGKYFDGVFVSNFIEHLPDQDSVGTVLAKLRDAMRPGGRGLLPPSPLPTRTYLQTPALWRLMGKQSRDRPQAQGMSLSSVIQGERGGGRRAHLLRERLRGHHPGVFA